MGRLQQIVMRKPYLAWYIKDPAKMSEAAVLESVLNYGRWKDFQQFLTIYGIGKTASLFTSSLAKRRSNYRPEIANYFTLYFSKYAPTSSK